MIRPIFTSNEIMPQQLNNKKVSDKVTKPVKDEQDDIIESQLSNPKQDKFERKTPIKDAEHTDKKEHTETVVQKETDKKADRPNSKENIEDKNAVSKKPEQEGLLEMFHSKVKNSADLNDVIKVPRTIFKGYLAFFASTTLGTLGSFAKKDSNLKKSFNVSSAILALYGTYAFVRPYLLKQEPDKSNKN